jgi:hypothetical protein
VDNSHARQAEDSRSASDALDSDLSDWIRTLRERLQRGELTALRRLTLDNGVVLVNLELTAKRLIDDLEELTALPAAERERSYTRRRRRQRVDTLRRLRQALEG